MVHRAHLAVLLLAAVGACAGPATRLRRDNQRLEGELEAVRAELRRDKRALRDLQTENLVLRDRLATVEGGAGDVPRLPVEVLAPEDDAAPVVDDPSLAEYGDDARVVATTDDGTEIVYVGDAATGRSVEAPEDLELEDVDDLEYAPDDGEPIDAPPPKKKQRPAKPKKAKPPPAPGKDAAAAAYDAAVAKVRAKDHEGAIAALRAFLEAYPRHDLADNAQYWLGEVYYDAKDYPRAIVEFRATIESYPRGNKAPDALLKLGYCFAALGQRDKARAALEQVVQSYPKTQPAELAAKKLKELR